MVTSFFQKAYYLLEKSILPFGKEVGISDNLTANIFSTLPALY